MEKPTQARTVGCAITILVQGHQEAVKMVVRRSLEWSRTALTGDIGGQSGSMVEMSRHMEDTTMQTELPDSSSV